MRVVAVPSLVGKAVYASCKCDLLKTLLDLRPEAYGLPAFEDYVHGTVPLEEPWRIKGPVVKGFGRGSRVRCRRHGCYTATRYRQAAQPRPVRSDTR